MSALVSDTRVIGAPMFKTCDLPTTSETGMLPPRRRRPLRRSPRQRCPLGVDGRGVEDGDDQNPHHHGAGVAHDA